MSMNNKDTWNQILEDGGSVQGLDELDNWGYVDGKLTKRRHIKRVNR